LLQQVSRSFISILALIVCTNVPSTALAYRSGPPAGRNGSTASGGVSCRACHGTAVGPGSVQIIGYPAQYMANVLYNIDVRVQDPTQVGAGFQISFETIAGVHAGTIIRTDTTGTQLNSGWLNHTTTGVNNSVLNWSSMGNAATFNLIWRAPSTDLGPIRAWGAGNAINNNFNVTGDIVYLTSETATFTVGPGACCDESTGTCEEDVFPAECSGPDDRFGGQGSTCATLDPPCIVVTGACCDGTTGDCDDGLLRAECVGDQLTFREFQVCADLLANGNCQRHRGACCDGTTGICRDAVLPEECVGDQEEWFKDTECTTFVCEQHRGACCDASPGAGGPGPEGVCTDDVLPGVCSGPDLSWEKAAICENLDSQCLEVQGACCNTLEGTCADDMYFGECQGAQRVWTQGAVCIEVSCEAGLGACCDQEPFGTCTETTSAQCDCEKCVWHKLLTCSQIECPHGSIPTVSQWGLAVLALLLLIGAKVHFGRWTRPASLSTKFLEWQIVLGRTKGQKLE